MQTEIQARDSLAVVPPKNISIISRALPYTLKYMKYISSDSCSYKTCEKSLKAVPTTKSKNHGAHHMCVYHK